MKKVYSIFAGVLLIPALFLTTGCTDKKTVKKTFNLTFEVLFDVQDQTNTTYQQIALLDASAQSSDFSKNKGEVIAFTLDSARYYTTYVVDPTTTQQINNAAITVGNEAGSDAITLGSVANVNLLSVFEEGNAQPLPLNTDGIAKFATMLRSSPNKAWIKFQGDVNQGPVDFKVRVKFYVTFQAYIL
jgi:hypothetical protein